MQNRLLREQVARFVIAGRDHTGNRRPHLDVLLQISDNLALNIQLRFGLVDLLLGDTAGLEDRQQTVVIVLDSAQLH